MVIARETRTSLSPVKYTIQAEFKHRDDFTFAISCLSLSSSSSSRISQVCTEIRPFTGRFGRDIAVLICCFDDFLFLWELPFSNRLTINNRVTNKSQNIAAWNFTCKLWIVPLTTYQLCIWSSFYARGGWVNLGSSPVCRELPQNWLWKIENQKNKNLIVYLLQENIGKSCLLLLLDPAVEFLWHRWFSSLLYPHQYFLRYGPPELRGW